MNLENFRLITAGRKSFIVIASVLLFFTCTLLGCKSQSIEEASKRELLIYCGTTMAPAIRELANLFEQRENCIVKIIKDGSGNLHRSIHINQVGDLYLPGSESYMEKCQAEGLVVESQAIGFNRAVFVVAKGNPLGINADLKNFVNGRYRTVLGAAESGSIGRETRIILNLEGIYRKAVKQALILATDSKELESVIKEKRADLTMNWNAAVQWGDNPDYVDVLRLDESIAPPHVLVLGLLKMSHYPVLARRFMTFADADEGRALFSRYGLGE